MRRLFATIAAAAGLLLAGRGAAPAPLGTIPRTNAVYTAAQVDKLVGAPAWDTATLGANPSVALAVAANTSYKRAGTGTLTLSSVTGLSSAPTYLIASGFSSLVLPSGFSIVGSGAFRAGKTNHFTLWATPEGNAVNFLFAE